MLTITLILIFLKNLIVIQEKTNEEAIKDEREPMNDYGIDDSNDHLVLNNAPDYANEEEEQYKEGSSQYDVSWFTDTAYRLPVKF
ncbi:hypothetical protein Tco_1547885 [Tanacetum coccineum]